MAKLQQPASFSDELESWIKGKGPKTLESLIDVFQEKSFAVIIMLLMLFPSLPLPTAGHVFEAVAALIAAEQVIGLKKLWLPKLVTSHINLEKLLKGKAATLILQRVRWLEDHSSPRWKWIYDLPFANRIIGLIIIGYCAAAFFAIPFSGLDTLPSFGVVLISLGMILNDAVLLAAGVFVGAIGISLSLLFGSAIVHFTKHLFH